MKKILFVLGPTATGKTALGVELALRLGGEIVSADSMQVYKRLSIGTAKPTRAEMRGIPHHLIDFWEPDQSFSAAAYRELALGAIEGIFQRGTLPIVVGGTGLYADSILKPLDFSAAKSDPKLREKWQAFLDQNGPDALHRELKKADPLSAERLHKNNTRRIIRALEVIELDRQPLSEQIAPPSSLRVGVGLSPLLIGLTMERPALYARIERRVDRMMEEGLPAELQRLLDEGLSPAAQCLQGIGYKELLPALRGEMGLDEATGLIKRNSRRYAKRQLTWFRANPAIGWHMLTESSSLPKLAEEIARDFLGNPTE
ncbi:MAG: tRNA (adenosine(37)-N6)-dimethylallyltransferase MiaA [Christensenellaceae bacterium]|jgi:tRNA dimethylallyltransferase|nr:tRNA (adenosine(37)-N6)-dimethylallyltransferase MiaA [Christensenellaceae bacterium]